MVIPSNEFRPTVGWIDWGDSTKVRVYCTCAHEISKALAFRTEWTEFSRVFLNSRLLPTEHVAFWALLGL